MTEPTTFPRAALERLLASTFGAAAPFATTELAGGASTRRFLRVGAGPAQSVIAMYVPVQHHELGPATAVTGRWPFLELRDLLEAYGVRVPRLYAEACEDGLLVVEDLGETLAEHLVHSPTDRDELYRIAVRDLGRAQQALSRLPADSVVLTRAFDQPTLYAELDHFREWGLEARGVTLSAAERSRFDAMAERLANTIAAWPRGFVHRDYQSRNLMVVRDGSGLGLAWIDFQDALLGPRAYDLVALLNDSYQSLAPDFVEQRLDEFARELGMSASERAELGREFRLVTVQRKLKDAGRFVFIDRRRNDSSFLRFVEPSLAKVERALADLADDPAVLGVREFLADTCSRV